MLSSYTIPASRNAAAALLSLRALEHYLQAHRSDARGIYAVTFPASLVQLLLVSPCNRARNRAKHYILLQPLPAWLASVLRALAHGPQNRSGLRTSRITPLEPVASDRSHEVTLGSAAQDRDKLLLSAHTQ